MQTKPTGQLCKPDIGCLLGAGEGEASFQASRLMFLAEKLEL